MSYTDEQIKSVCEDAMNVLDGLTDTQNITFPTEAIINGMKNGLTPEQIGSNARAAIEELPLFNNGTYNFTGSNMTIFNLSSYMEGAIITSIKNLEPVDEESDDENPDSNPDQDNND